MKAGQAPLLVSALALALLLPHLASAAPRTWTAADGRTIDAELTGYDPDQGMIELKVGDRPSYHFPIGQLIEADRQRVLDIYFAEGDETAKRIDQLVRRRLGEQLNSQPYFTTLQAMVNREPESDAAFLQRMATAIIGRDPSAEELAAFEENSDPDKRRQRINELLDSEEFVKHFTSNFLAELLQIDGVRPAKTPYPECEDTNGEGKKRFRESRAALRSIPQPALYREWVEQQVREDRPWDKLITELLTASGAFTENPATAYLIANSGEPHLKVNPAPVMTAFAGAGIACAQCHHHPHEEIYQRDFFSLAAFFGGLAIDFSRNEATATGYDFALSDHPLLTQQLPPDYTYADGDPGDAISPLAYFGTNPKIEDPSRKRHAFADWLTDKENPRFTLNIANRLWAYVFGHAPIHPVDNLPAHLAEGSYDMRLMMFLREVMQRENFQLREFLRILYHSETFCGILAQEEDTADDGDEGEKID